MPLCFQDRRPCWRPRSIPEGQLLCGISSQKDCCSARRPRTALTQEGHFTCLQGHLLPHGDRRLFILFPLLRQLLPRKSRRQAQSAPPDPDPRLDTLRPPGLWPSVTALFAVRLLPGPLPRLPALPTAHLLLTRTILLPSASHSVNFVGVV